MGLGLWQLLTIQILIVIVSFHLSCQYSPNIPINFTSQNQFCNKYCLNSLNDLKILLITWIPKCHGMCACMWSCKLILFWSQELSTCLQNPFQAILSHFRPIFFSFVRGGVRPGTESSSTNAHTCNCNPSPSSTTPATTNTHHCQPINCYHPPQPSSTDTTHQLHPQLQCGGGGWGW